MSFPENHFDLMYPGFRRDVEYVIDMPGLAVNTLGNVMIDCKYALIQEFASNTLYVAPPFGHDLPDFEDLVFFTHCLSYEHDLPAHLSPRDGLALIRPVEQGNHDYINTQYVINITTAYECLNAIKLGPLAWIAFRWPSIAAATNLDYSKKYSQAHKEIGLYSNAMRQIDPLAEYLFYYRVIESIAGDNGKDWVNQHLPDLQSHDFGFLEIGFDAKWMGQRTRRMNLFTVYRRRALSRLRYLSTRLGTENISRYLYNENRCGIAHGRGTVKEHDFGHDMWEVAQDISILKLLARIAIDARVSSGYSLQ